MFDDHVSKLRNYHKCYSQLPAVNNIVIRILRSQEASEFMLVKTNQLVLEMPDGQ